VVADSAATVDEEDEAEAEVTGRLVVVGGDGLAAAAWVDRSVVVVDELDEITVDEAVVCAATVGDATVVDMLDAELNMLDVDVDMLDVELEL
jgi:hypothetical protein